MTGPSDAGAPVRALERAIADGTLPAGGRVLLALSGGCDSASLLHALDAVGAWELSAGVVDHGLSPGSGPRAEAAAAYADRLGVPVVILRADARSQPGGSGPEATARDVRYRALRDHAARTGAEYIVTAHTADDQAETVVMRLAQGTGLRGMGGMRAVRDVIRRPWLGVSRSDVGAYAHAWNVPVVHDPTNADDRFLRNVIRRRISPQLARAFDTRWALRVARSAEHAQGAIDLLDALLVDAPHLIRRAGDRIEVPRDALVGLTPAARAALLDKALSIALGGGRRRRRHVYGLLDLPVGGHRSLPGGWRGRSTVGAIVLEPSEAVAAASAPCVVKAAESFTWGPWSFGITRGRLGDDPAAIALDPARAPLPWIVRTARPGERMRPRGAPGRKPLGKLWAGVGVPARWRRALPVIESDGRIIWAAGLRAADDVRVMPDAPAWLLSVDGPSASGVFGGRPHGSTGTDGTSSVDR